MRDSIPKVSDRESEKLGKIFQPQIKKAAERMTKAALNAGMASNAQADFLRALERMQKVAGKAKSLAD